MVLKGNDKPRNGDDIVISGDQTSDMDIPNLRLRNLEVYIKELDISKSLVVENYFELSGGDIFVDKNVTLTLEGPTNKCLGLKQAKVSRHPGDSRSFF